MEDSATQLKAYEERLKNRESNISSTISQKVNDKAKSAEATAKTKVYIPFLIALLYGIGITLLSAITSEAFRTDFKGFFVFIGQKIIIGGFNAIRGLIASIATLALKITHPVWSTVLWWVIVIVGIIIVLGIIFLFLLGIKRFIAFYSEHMADFLSLGVLLFTLAVVVVFSSQIKSIISWNLMAILFFSNLLYTCIRATREWINAR